VSGESGRIYDEDDVVLAEQLGQRAGLAIDNAQLYQAEKEATARLQLLVEMSELMTRSLGYETSLARLAEVAIEHLADFCIIDVLDDEGGLERITAVHRDPAKQQFAEQLKEWAPSMENAQNPVVRAIGSGQPQHGALEETLVAAIASNESHLQAIRGLQGAAYMCLPLIARGRVLGALTMGSERPYREETFDLATEFARRAAMAIDNARLFTDRARVADMLQRSLLPPSLPDILGVEVAASFRAAGAGSEVGGDFYDLFQLPGEAWAIAIGDVCGRGAEAAAATALARHSIRGGALRGEQPKEVLSMLNEEVLSSGDDRFCTVVFATLTPHPRSAQLTLARGGHPAPILVRSAGDARRLEPAGSLIGVFDSPDFDHETVDLFPGDFVVFYTDGVTERARSLQGEDQLVELLVSYAGLEAEAIVKRLDQAIMGTEKKGLEDDVAVLVLRVQPVAEQAAHLSGEDDAAPNP